LSFADKLYTRPAGGGDAESQRGSVTAAEDPRHPAATTAHGQVVHPMCVLQEDADKLRDQLEEEELSRSEAQRQLQKTQAEMAAMQQRLEGSMAGAAQQELDELKRKLNARVQEGTISNIFIYLFI